MGDPRRLKNKYSKPKKLLDKARILEDSKLKRSFGLKNMRELWLAAEELKKVRREARRLLSLPASQREKEQHVVLSKLQRLGVLDEKSKIEDILSLTVKDVLERRLQTRVLRKGLAKTMAQARQLITHGFIAIGRRMVDIPSYLVAKAEDSGIRHYKKIEIELKQVVESPKETQAAAPAQPEAEKPAETATPKAEG
ncbi:30S ribosomal protein S4 [Candidatus Micrarchaeota archaeon]|nr:30S ribosomal protein S4 [Candidatus Micrarchaeota archaeon]